jgi:hypothetical protein
MKPHPRIRKTIKWGGAAVTVLLVVAWIGSRWRLFGWAGGGRGWMVCSGRLCLTKNPDIVVYAPNGAFFQTCDSTWPFDWWFSGRIDDPGFEIWIPLWAPGMFILILTAVAWRWDALARRARLNLCPKCNYDRAGIAADAKCPECGAMPVVRR